MAKLSFLWPHGTRQDVVTLKMLHVNKEQKGAHSKCSGYFQMLNPEP